MLRMRLTPLCPGLSTQSGDGVSDVPPGSNHVRWDLPRLHSRWGVKGGGSGLAASCTCPRPATTPPEHGHDRDCAHLVFPDLITHVSATDATVTSNQRAGAIDDELAAKILVRLELSVVA
jgi:hypothetical protein